MRYFHWLSGPPCRKRIATRHNTVSDGDVSITMHPISHCQTKIYRGLSRLSIIQNSAALCIRVGRNRKKDVPILELFSTLACIYIVLYILFLNAVIDKGKFVT